MKGIVGILFIVSAGWALKCKKTKDGAAEACADSDTVCSGPMWVDYTGPSSAAYKCGTCATDTKDKTCKECATDGCNTAPEAGTEFQCRAFENKDSKWGYAKKNTTCKPAKDVGIKCNMPKNETTKSTAFTTKVGCGACNADEKKKGDCVECAKKLCNTWTSGARSIAAAFFALPLFAFTYALL